MKYASSAKSYNGEVRLKADAALTGRMWIVEENEGPRMAPVSGVCTAQ